MTGHDVLVALTAYEAATAAALFAAMFPADDHSAAAPDIGVVRYVDRALHGPYRGELDLYRLGLDTLDHLARREHGIGFQECPMVIRAGFLQQLESGALPELASATQQQFFDRLCAHMQEGLFADPVHGGNIDKQGWRFLEHPGLWLENSAEENLATEPVTKGGIIQSLSDVRDKLPGAAPAHEEATAYDSQRQHRRPQKEADIVLVGVGAMGSVVAPILAGAGLKVVGLEAGTWRTSRHFIPDEVSSAYYCRGEMGAKFLAEAPRWRRNTGDTTREATFSLGRMMNSVGGSVIHWGGALRRCHPHHFSYLSYIRDRYGEDVLPEGHTLVDWPLDYDDLERYYTTIEHLIGVAGDESNPYIQRSRPLPLPPMRPFTTGETFREATSRMGLHPYPTPVAANSEPYNGNPRSSYCAWSGGFGPMLNDRWYPGHTSVPQALETGNFDLRTRCRVTKILTDERGNASGVEYIDAHGERHVQCARTVILCSYTFENVRLMFLSGTTRHPDGLGNSDGQLGKHFMTKIWGDVYGHVPDKVFNGHTGPAAQMWSLDDFISTDFDSTAHGFVGGATPNVENQRLPIQISREALPPDVPRWGQAYKDHLRGWQQWAAVRLQPDSLPYATDFLDLDPVHTDRSGLGMPLVRITCDLHENERRLADFMETVAEDILDEMGAVRTWRGQRFRGVCSSHDLGGARMGTDPTTSVVDPDLRVHDTPGLYVFGGATFPTCHGVNPTLTMWAVCYRAAERLCARLQSHVS